MPKLDRRRDRKGGEPQSPPPPLGGRIAPVTFAGTRIVQCVSFKYVGVWFHEDCTYETLFEKLVTRARGALFACDGRADRLDKSCPLAVRCMMARVYVFPLLTYCCEALPVPDRFIREAHSLLYDYAVKHTGVRGAVVSRMGLPFARTVACQT